MTGEGTPRRDVGAGAAHDDGAADTGAAAGGRAAPEPARFGLRVRLVLAFVALAVLSVVVLALVVLLAGRVELSSAAQVRQELTAERVAALIAEAQDEGQLDTAVLLSASALAAAEGAGLSLLDGEGDPIDPADLGVGPGDHFASMPHGRGGAGGSGPSDGRGDGPPMGAVRDHARMMERMGQPPTEPDGPTRTVAVEGLAEPISTVALTFPATRAAPEQQLAAGVSRSVWLAVVAVAVLAVGLAWLVSRQLVRPVAALSTTVERIAQGERQVRTGARDAPGELGTLAGSVDRMADALDRQEELRRELVANVAHELRTPLAVALGEAEAMLDGVRPVTLEQVASIRDEVATLARLVGDLESLAAAEAAVLSLDRGPVDLGALVEERLDRARDRLEVEDRTLLLDADTDCVVDGDAHRLAQVIDNLVRNAIAHTPSSGRIEVAVRRVAERVELTVHDDGPGIPLQERPRIFDRFYRGAAAAGRQGSGVGLAIVAELITAHGGHVAAVEPPDSRGACLRVVLPAAAG